MLSEQPFVHFERSPWADLGLNRLAQVCPISQDQWHRLATEIDERFDSHGHLSKR